MKNNLNLSKSISVALKNPLFRLSLSLFFGMIVNFIYIAGNLSSALVNRSVWSGGLTVYHSLFLALRFSLLSAKHRSMTASGIRRVCLRTGIYLLLLDGLVGAIMIYTIRSGRVVSYSGTVLLGFVIYTVYSLSSSIIGMRRHLNDNQPLYFATRNMTLAAALMSVFNLQYSVLVTLGASYYIIDRIIVFSGFSIFFVIILLAVRLVVKNLPRGSKI